MTRWSKASDQAIHCYRDGTNASIALAPKSAGLKDLPCASGLNFTSGSRTAQLNQILVLENHATRYAALKILKIQDDTRNDEEDLLVFEYWILEDGSEDFSIHA